MDPKTVGKVSPSFWNSQFKNPYSDYLFMIMFKPIGYILFYSKLHRALPLNYKLVYSTSF